MKSCPLCSAAFAVKPEHGHGFCVKRIPGWALTIRDRMFRLVELGEKPRLGPSTEPRREAVLTLVKG